MISSSLKSALHQSFHSWKLPLINYILQGLIIFGLGFFSYQQLFAIFSNILINPETLEAHSFGLYTDLARLVDVKAVKILLIHFGLIAFAYQLLTIFTAGGNMDTVLEKQFKTQRFFIQSRKYFFTSFRLAIIKLLCNALILIISSLGIYFIVNKLNGHSETIIFLSILPLAVLFALFNFLLTNTFWLSLKHFMNCQASLSKSFYNSFILQLRSPSLLSAIGISVLIGLTVSIFVFHTLPVFTPSITMVLASFLIQQFVTFLQFFVRVWRLHLIAQYPIFK